MAWPALDRSVARDRQAKASGLVALFLGLNAWAQLLLLPALAVGLWSPRMALALLAAPVGLTLGVWLRREWLLLWVVPTALLLPLIAMPELLAPARLVPLRLAASAASLVVYILAIAWVAASRLPTGGAIVTTKLSPRPRPPRWARRERIFWGLAGVTVILPIALLGYVLYDATLLRRLDALYGAPRDAMQILLAMGVLLLWLGIVRWAIIGVLDLHRGGDVELLARVDALARRPTLRPGFVLAITAGIAAVAAISVLR